MAKPMTNTNPSVFISYSHKDAAWMEQLVEHLRVYELENLLTVWEDRQIRAGQDWLPEIERAIQQARVAIFLISRHFLISDFIRGKEVPPILKRRAEDGLLVVPVIVRTCDWQSVSWLSGIQARPPGKPLSGLRGDARDAALTEIAKEIKSLLQIKQPPQPSSPNPAPPAEVETLGPAVHHSPVPIPASTEERRPDKPIREQAADDIPSATKIDRPASPYSRYLALLIGAFIAVLLLLRLMPPPVEEKSSDQPTTGSTIEEPATKTPDFTERQVYLGPAPEGIDARYAWTLPGGTCKGVDFMFVGSISRFIHEDLKQPEQQTGQFTDDVDDAGWRDFEVATLGVLNGKKNGYGITGICPDAGIKTASVSGESSSLAITRAADMLRPGDIMLVALNRPGPRFEFTTQSGGAGNIPISWWPDDLAAIRYATKRGILVVEAAGNGSENLDDPIYDAPASGFPASWRNPFMRDPVDSGSIIVGAGAPPPAVRGQSYKAGPDRSREDYSNYGLALDAQGWGREVTTTGYGDLQGGSDEARWYTSKFAGTGSASAMVAGALGCVQGVLRAKGASPLTPREARDLLRSTGSPQQDAAGKRIGARPDLRQLIPAALALRRR